LKGTKLMTEEGKELGTIIDAEFSEIDGKISGYEVSGGAVADVYTGRSFVPVTEAISVGKDVAFVPSRTEEKLQTQVGGIKAATEDHYAGMKQTVQERSPELQAKASEVGDELRQSVSTFWEDVKHRVTELKDRTTQEVEQNRIKNALGRPVSRVILDTNDQPILDSGQLITHEAIEKAREAGVLDILLSSVYDKEPELTKEDMKVRRGV
jgi:uncharacterized protein YoxC